MLPEKFAWLANEPGPEMLVRAVALFGVHETAGPGDNPDILAWAKETGCAAVYRHDDTPWCGLFCALVARRAGETPPDHFLWALNWAGFGDMAHPPMLGDVLVFKRFDGHGAMIGGHVGLYVGENADSYFVLGGNERDQVNIVPIAKARLHMARRSRHISPQAKIRAVHIDAHGALSTNEV